MYENIIYIWTLLITGIKELIMIMVERHAAISIFRSTANSNTIKLHANKMAVFRSRPPMVVNWTENITLGEWCMWRILILQFDFVTMRPFRKCGERLMRSVTRCNIRNFLFRFDIQETDSEICKLSNRYFIATYRIEFSNLSSTSQCPSYI